MKAFGIFYALRDLIHSVIATARKEGLYIATDDGEATLARLDRRPCGVGR
jgi:hypothetical protein